MRRGKLPEGLPQTLLDRSSGGAVEEVALCGDQQRDGTASILALCHLCLEDLILRPQWKKFADEYLRLWNQTEAAIAAGYSERSAYNQGSRLMKNDEVKAYIAERLAEMKLSADEVLIRLGQQARGEQAEFIGLHERKDPDTGARWMEPEFDFERCREDGKLHLIKGWSYDRTGRLQLDFYDAQVALVQLGKHHRLFSEGVDVTSGGKPVHVQIYIPDNGRG